MAINRANFTTKTVQKVARAYEQATGRKWLTIQQEEVKRILLDPQMTQLFIAPRRNAKTEGVLALIAFLCANGARILFTIHRESGAKSAFSIVKKLLDTWDVKHRSERSRMEIECNGGGCAFFRTRTAGVGVSEGFDWLVVDEVQLYTKELKADLEPLVATSWETGRFGKITYLGTCSRLTSTGDVLFDAVDELEKGGSQVISGKIWGAKKFTEHPKPADWRKKSVNPSYGVTVGDDYFRNMLRGDLFNFNVEQLGWFNRQTATARGIPDYKPSSPEYRALSAPAEVADDFGLTPDTAFENLALRMDLANGNICVIGSAKVGDNYVIKPVAQVATSAGLSWLRPVLERTVFNYMTLDVSVWKTEIWEIIKATGFPLKRVSMTSARDYIGAVSSFRSMLEMGTVRVAGKGRDEWLGSVLDVFSTKVGRNGAETWDWIKFDVSANALISGALACQKLLLNDVSAENSF